MTSKPVTDAMVEAAAKAILASAFTEGEMPPWEDYEAHARAALEAALAIAPAQLGAASPEPVAWRWRYDNQFWAFRSTRPKHADDVDVTCEPLYTHPPASPPTGAESDDFRWLIEAPGQQYLAVQRLRQSDNFEWTTDHNKALAFRTQEQADALMMAVRQLDRELDSTRNHGDLSWGKLFAFEPTLGNAKAVEHGWLPRARSQEGS